MSSETRDAGAVAKQAPTEQQESSAGQPRRLVAAQTVCNEKNEKGKLCNGHIKQLNTQHPSEVHLRGDDTLYRCQACGALYMGPPLGHVRDTRRQRRYVERDLAAILQAAGGTLPAYQYPTPGWRDAPPPRPAKAKAAAPPAAASSSPSADRHRPAAEAQAATGQASAAPMSPTAATASPAAGAETAADLAPSASTELTPGAPKDERPAAEAKPAAPAAEAKPAAAPKAKKGAHSGFKVGPEFREQPGETNEQKIARLKRLVEEAKRAAGKL
ncbi:MAG TPA: hypothetical protein VK422_12065 [Pyrinomonadaceae bacterium]|nr:hypothetical protein [Pyrinomonadaceae bacterium]